MRQFTLARFDRSCNQQGDFSVASGKIKRRGCNIANYSYISKKSTVHSRSDYLLQDSIQYSPKGPHRSSHNFGLRATSAWNRMMSCSYFYQSHWTLRAFGLHFCSGFPLNKRFVCSVTELPGRLAPMPLYNSGFRGPYQ